MKLKSKYTRFRAYKLGKSGALYSYYDGRNFTLIEAFLTDDCIDQINEELKICKVYSGISCLHITSWDADHCDADSLEQILEILKPKRIEYPGYPIDPRKQNQKDCWKLLKDYIKNNKENNRTVVTKKITPAYISTLSTYTKWVYRDVIYPNKKNYIEPNNNSNIRLFRSGCFSVLSVGDIDNAEIKDYLLGLSSILEEVDVLLIAHHGADNNVNVKDFFEKINPTTVICSSNYDNQYEHPRTVVRTRLNELSIPFKTTKSGDVIIESTGDDTSNYTVRYMQADNTDQRGRAINYKSKRARQVSFMKTVRTYIKFPTFEEFRKNNT